MRVDWFSVGVLRDLPVLVQAHTGHSAEVIVVPRIDGLLPWRFFRLLDSTALTDEVKSVVPDR